MLCTRAHTSHNTRPRTAPLTPISPPGLSSKVKLALGQNLATSFGSMPSKVGSVLPSRPRLCTLSAEHTYFSGVAVPSAVSRT